MKNDTLSIFLKRLRLNNRDEKLKDMALKLKISTAYLSSIETGKRKMNLEVLDQIIKIYKLTEEESVELKYLRDMATDEINVKVNKMDDDKKTTLINFLSQVEGLDDNELKKINLILKKQKGDNKK
jgi:transcriptional regulator with XRE-family HTH domain